MFPEVLWAVPPVAAAVPIGAAVWHHWAPMSYSYGPGAVGSALRVNLTWNEVADGCGLVRTRMRRGPKGRRQVTQVPRLVRRSFRPSGRGFRVRVKLLPGQTPEAFAEVLGRFSHAWRVRKVWVERSGPGWVELRAVRDDPLETASVPPGESEDWELLRVVLGVLDTGEPWVLDFRQVPHWLDMGATQSGKSTDVNALVWGLAPQPVALAGLDLKGGVELTPFKRRLSALASTRPECVTLLQDLLADMEARQELCAAHNVRDIWRLPEDKRPWPVVLVVDEVAELYLMADKAEKDEIARAATALLRVAQLGRAFGMYLFVCGQRVGSDLGPGVTALRSQLTGRICHRVNDAESAKMALSDVAPQAMSDAMSIPPDRPGTAVVIGADGRPVRARSFHRTEQDAQDAAEVHAEKAPVWEEVVGTPRMQGEAA